MTPASKERREALLSELESIRSMLGEDSHGDNIPVLTPEDHGIAPDHIPVLSVIAGETAAAPVADPLQAIRQAAAKVVANTGRHRSRAIPEHIPAPKSSVPVASTIVLNDREKLVDDIVRGAMPRLEALLRELVQEALLQEKLRGGKR